MSEFPEVVGSKPSVPEQKSLQQKPKLNNLNGYAGFFLCAVFLSIFPKYANTDNLSTGIFYGVSFILLFLAIIGLWIGLSKNWGNKSLYATAKPARPRKRWGLYVTRLCFGLILFVFYLLEFPTMAGFLWGVVFIALFITVIVVYRVLSRQIRSSKPLEAAGIESKSTKSQQKPGSNGLKVSIVYLLLGLCFLATPKIGPMSDFINGFFYGMGLIISLMAILGVCNTIAKQFGNKVLSWQ
jgi:Na+-transporting methylmalonyl-CoA/oxaloacetate decarboxylase gamma subunit